MGMTFGVRTSPPSELLIQRRARLNALGKALAKAVDQSADLARRDIVLAMQSAGLGKLPNALRYTSDLKKGHVPDASAAGARFRVGATIYATHGSDRTAAALAAYAVGTTIIPRRGKWLAFATDEIPRLTGRKRMTPELYEANGYDRRIGPLVFINSKHPGEAFLIVHDVQVNAARGYGSARRLPQHGRAGPGRKAVGFIIAFILIRTTSRARRFDPGKAFERRVAEIPANTRAILRGRGRSGALTGPSLGSASYQFTQ